MQNIKEIQAQRQELYGDFLVHCNIASQMLGCEPIKIAQFYILTKLTRWLNCPKERNKDSLVDLLSYIDLAVAYFGSSDRMWAGFPYAFNPLADQLICAVRGQNFSRAYEVANKMKEDYEKSL